MTEGPSKGRGVCVHSGAMRMRNVATFGSSRPSIASLASIASLVALSALIGACGGGGETPPPNTPASTSNESTETATSETKPAETSDASGIKVGSKAPTFAMDSLNGAGKVTITPGKVTLVDFWATWCEPCKKSFPKYQELYVKYKASGLEIAALSVDDEKGEIPGFAKTHKAKFPVGWDDGKKVAGQYKPENMPTAYIVDKEGVVRFVHNGYHDGEEKEIEKEIKSLF